MWFGGIACLFMTLSILSVSADCVHWSLEPLTPWFTFTFTYTLHSAANQFYVSCSFTTLFLVLQVHLSFIQQLLSRYWTRSTCSWWLSWSLTHSLCPIVEFCQIVCCCCVASDSAVSSQQRAVLISLRSFHLSASHQLWAT